MPHNDPLGTAATNGKIYTTSAKTMVIATIRTRRKPFEQIRHSQGHNENQHHGCRKWQSSEGERPHRDQDSIQRLRQLGVPGDIARPGEEVIVAMSGSIGFEQLLTRADRAELRSSCQRNLYTRS